MGASSCKLALVRAHFILGEVEEADALLKSAGANMLFYNNSIQGMLKAMKEKPIKLQQSKKKES